jgi:hypothetical protein
VENAVTFSHLALIAALALFSACGDDAPSSDNNIFIPDMGQEEDVTVDAKNDVDVPDLSPDAEPDMVDIDMADMGPDVDLTCPTVPCGTNEVCLDGACVADTSCGLAADLGVLTSGVAVNDSGSFLTDGRDNLSASCSGATSSSERVVKFTLSERSLVDFAADWTGQFDGTVSIRTTCEDVNSEVLCDDNETGARLLDAGDYFVVLEMKFGNPGTYDLTIQSETSGCTLGQATCMQDTLLTCPNGTVPEPIACPDSCTSGACDGDSCASAITVTGAGGTYTADAGALSSTLNFGSNVSCGSVATPGFEVVFYLPGLTAGQIVNVNGLTGDNNVNAIFITSACGATETCVANYVSENVEWVVQTGGDYYVVVDKLLNSRSPFTYTINIF